MDRKNYKTLIVTSGIAVLLFACKVEKPEGEEKQLVGKWRSTSTIVQGFSSTGALDFWDTIPSRTVLDFDLYENGKLFFHFPFSGKYYAHDIGGVNLSYGIPFSGKKRPIYFFVIEYNKNRLHSKTLEFINGYYFNDTILVGLQNYTPGLNPGDSYRANNYVILVKAD